MTKWLILIGIIVFTCIVEWIREIVTFKVTHYDIKSDKLNCLNHERKIVFLSDLHNNRYGKNNEKLLDAVKLQEPDLILIGGDMLVGQVTACSKTAEDFVRQLAHICSVYYANGNHEQRMKIYPETYGTKYQDYKRKLEKCGITFLENDKMELVWDSCPIQIHGLEIPAMGYMKFKKTTLSIDEVTECIGKAETSKYQILLAHNPIYVDTYISWGADLVLSGHLHGGVVRVPGVGGMITPQFRLFPKYSGEHTKVGESDVVVSKGLGTHTIKVRFLNPAEVVVLHIHGKDK